MVGMPAGLCHSKALNGWAWGIRGLAQVLLVFTMSPTQFVSLLSFCMSWCLSPLVSVKELSLFRHAPHILPLTGSTEKPPLPSRDMSVLSKGLNEFFNCLQHCQQLEVWVISSFSPRHFGARVLHLLMAVLQPEDPHEASEFVGSRGS